MTDILAGDDVQLNKSGVESFKVFLERVESLVKDVIRSPHHFRLENISAAPVL